MAPEYLDSVLKDALGKCQVAFLGSNGCVGDGLVGFLNGFDQIFSGCVHFRVSHAVVPFLATLCDKHRSRCILLGSICILHLYAENVKSQRQGIGHKRVTSIRASGIMDSSTSFDSQGSDVPNHSECEHKKSDDEEQAKKSERILRERFGQKRIKHVSFFCPILLCYVSQRTFHPACNE